MLAILTKFSTLQVVTMETNKEITNAFFLLLNNNRKQECIDGRINIFKNRRRIYI